MKTISSKWTVFYKRLFPTLWFGGIITFLVTSLASRPAGEDLMFLMPPVFMLVFGFFFMRKLVWVLADEVRDGGDYLVVRNGSKEERVDLSNVINVNVSTMTNPPRVTLRLEKPSRFGPEVTFTPAASMSINPFARNKVGEDLIVRADQARRKKPA